MPSQVSSFRSRALLAIAIATLIAGAWWLTRSGAESANRSPVRRTAQSSHRPPAPSSAARPDADRVTPSATPTRDEIVGYLLATYRKELLTRELDLEQRRYGDAYWKSDRSGPALARLRADRAAVVAQLTTEANQVLASMLPNESPGTIALTSFFDEDRPGPNVGFMSADSRRRFEAQVLATGVTRPEDLTEVAAATLTAPELALYHAWNDRPNAALRNELIGFDTTQSEFLAILDAEKSPEGPDPASAAKLEAQLGHDRYAQLLQLESPTYRTAVHDLNRLGLPLADASWLASTRAAATTAIQQVWQDKMLPDSTKSDRVALLQREYGQAIATKLALPGSDLDELGVLR